jgi:hypothetical protein
MSFFSFLDIVTGGNLDKIIGIIKSPRALFVQAFMWKWYFLVVIPAVTIAAIVFKRLADTGIFTRIEDFITAKIMMLTKVAYYCTPKVLVIREFIRCLSWDF